MSVMDELAQQKAFSLQIAQRLFLCAEVLSIRAERKKPKGQPMQDYTNLLDYLDSLGTNEIIAKDSPWLSRKMKESSFVIRTLVAEVEILNNLVQAQNEVIKKQAAQLADLRIEQ